MMRRNERVFCLFGAYLTIGLLLAATVVRAQINPVRTYTIRGQVFSVLDNLPIPNVQVFLRGTDLGATADSTGVFEIHRVPPGIYDLVAKYPDFDAVILSGIEIPPKTQRTYIFNLNPLASTEPLPYLDLESSDSLGVLEGTVNVKIDTFRAAFKEGWLNLRAVVIDRATEAYVYPVKWRILPAEEQQFRFKFFLPRGQSYRLYLVWQSERKGSIAEKIVDVARVPGKPNVAARFDLGTNERIGDIVFDFSGKNVF